jgi:hypothetical protein
MWSIYIQHEMCCGDAITPIFHIFYFYLLKNHNFFQRNGNMPKHYFHKHVKRERKRKWKSRGTTSAKGRYGGGKLGEVEGEVEDNEGHLCLCVILS